MALKSDIARDRRWFVGEDKVLAFTIWEDADMENPQDLSGWTLSFVFYQRRTLAFSATPTVVDASAGRADVTITGEQTEGLDSLKELHYVLRRTNAGARTIVAFGDVVLNTPEEV